MNPLLMPALNLIVHFFKNRRFIRNVVVPLVASAEHDPSLATNEDKRQWVLSLLVNRGLSESDARLLLEAGVRLWQKHQAKLAKRAARRAKHEG